MAYRVTSADDAEQDGDAQNKDLNQDEFDQSEASTYVTEGYDDSNEDGCGEKLLGLL